MASKGKKGTQRKLIAILCADVVGYGRLMGDDEEATIGTLSVYCTDRASCMCLNLSSAPRSLLS